MLHTQQLTEIVRNPSVDLENFNVNTLPGGLRNLRHTIAVCVKAECMCFILAVDG